MKNVWELDFIYSNKTRYFDRWATVALEYAHALSLTLIFGSRWVEGVCCLNWIYCALWQCVILFNVCVSESYIETCNVRFFIYWHPTTEWEKLKCLIYDCTVLVAVVYKDVFWTVPDIYTKLDFKKENVWVTSLIWYYST